MKKNLLFPLVYLVLLTVCVAGVSFSKYQVSVCGTDVVRVARPVVAIAPQTATLYDSDNNATPITNITSGISLSNLQPGDKLVYDFNIQNQDNNGNINEVKLNYNIAISFSSSALPLTYTLMAYDDATSTYVAYSSFDGTTTIPGSTVSLPTGNGYSKKYELTVSWDSSQADPGYTNQNESVQVTVNAVQVDS